MTRIPTEHEEQCALIEWAAFMANGIEPQLQWLHAVPNAGAGAQRGQAGKMKAEGVKPGVPDLSLPVPMGRYHGAYIEMKRSLGGQLTPKQIEWRDHLVKVGYAHCVAAGFDDARRFLIAYLERTL